MESVVVTQTLQGQTPKGEFFVFSAFYGIAPGEFSSYLRHEAPGAQEVAI
jgi:hypothetical protein